MKIQKYTLLAAIGSGVAFAAVVHAASSVATTSLPTQSTSTQVTIPTAPAVAVAQVAAGQANLPQMTLPVADPKAWVPADADKNAKPLTAVLVDKGQGNENLIFKQVDVCDQNNIWCVANDGKKDAVYQITKKGPVFKIDGVYVSAGKEIVSVINNKQELYELKGGQGSDWKKVDGVNLTQVSRPLQEIGWGVLKKEDGSLQLFEYDHGSDKWAPVKSVAAVPVDDIQGVRANAEHIVIALNKDGFLSMRDLDREELHVKVKAAATNKKKEHKKKNKKKDKKDKEVAE